MPNKKWLGKYEVIGIERDFVGDDDPVWRVDVGIRRPWPLSWFDHRPWEKFPRRHWPVRTFIGKGIAWSELAGKDWFAAGSHEPVLNAIISDHTASSLT